MEYLENVVRLTFVNGFSDEDATAARERQVVYEKTEHLNTCSNAKRSELRLRH